MADGRREDQWNHTAYVLAMLVNTAANKKRGTRARPADFHPFMRREKKLSRQESREALADLFGVNTHGRNGDTRYDS
jgi:hypothetical protein